MFHRCKSYAKVYDGLTLPMGGVASRRVCDLQGILSSFRKKIYISTWSHVPLLLKYEKFLFLTQEKSYSPIPVVGPGNENEGQKNQWNILFLNTNVSHEAGSEANWNGLESGLGRDAQTQHVTVILLSSSTLSCFSFPASSFLFPLSYSPLPYSPLPCSPLSCSLLSC